MKKRHIIVCIIIVIIIAGLSCLGFYVDSLKANKDKNNTNIDSKIAEFGDNIDTAQTVQILNDAIDLPESSELTKRSTEHLSRIDEQGKFKEYTIGQKEEKQPIVEEKEKNFPHFFVASIMDRRRPEHYVYDITVDNDKSYSVMMTTIPDSDEEVPDYLDEKYKHETKEDILGDAEFSLLKSLLQAYTNENIAHEKEDTAEYYIDITVSGSNTLEETAIWVADRLLDKEVEHLDPNKGIIKTVMGFDDITDYIVQGKYAEIKEQLTEQIEKKEEPQEDDEVIYSYDMTEDG